MLSEFITFETKFNRRLLATFVDELKILLEDGIQLNGKLLKLKVNCFVCDAPARAFMKGIVGHNAYFACEKCFVEGEYNYISNHQSYTKTDCQLRNNENFRNRIQEEHHKAESPLEELPIDMIKLFPLDFMHLILIGVSKRILQT